MTRIIVVTLIAGWVTCYGGQIIASGVQAPQPAAKAAVPIDPVTAIVDAFKTHQIVAIGDNDGSNQGHALRLALIRAPRLIGIVNDIVVEFGNARYQSVMDRFISGGDVPADELRHVWQDTTQIEETWDLPIYEEFFRTVREVNASRPPDRRMRVLLGDPPVDWSQVHTGADLTTGLDRDGHAADVIHREVLAKSRRALVIYGDQHLIRKNLVVGAPDEWTRGVVALLEMNGTASVFNVHTETRADLAAIQPDIATWPRPSLARLAGTTLGQQLDDPGPGKRAVRLEEQFDAVLYLGPPATMTIAQLSPSQCADETYVRMRSERLGLLAAPKNAPFDPSDRIRVICAFQGPGSPITDRDPTFTALLRDTLIDAAKGAATETRFSAELRPRLVLFMQTYAPRILGPMGTLTGLTLTGDATIAGKHLRRYQASFERGSMVWIVGVGADGTISSMDPRRE